MVEDGKPIDRNSGATASRSRSSRPRRESRASPRSTRCAGRCWRPAARSASSRRPDRSSSACHPRAAARVRPGAGLPSRRCRSTPSAPARPARAGETARVKRPRQLPGVRDLYRLGRDTSRGTAASAVRSSRPRSRTARCSRSSRWRRSRDGLATALQGNDAAREDVVTRSRTASSSAPAARSTWTSSCRPCPRRGASRGS